MENEATDRGKGFKDVLARVNGVKRSIYERKSGNGNVTSEEKGQILEEISGLIVGMQDPKTAREALRAVESLIELQDRSSGLVEDIKKVVVDNLAGLDEAVMASKDDLELLGWIIGLGATMVQQQDTTASRKAMEWLFAKTEMMKEAYKKDRSFCFTIVDVVKVVAEKGNEQQKEQVFQFAKEIATENFDRSGAGFLSDFLSNKNSEIRDVGVKITQDLLTNNFGLPGALVVEKWMKSTGNWESARAYNFRANIVELMALEAARPGAARALYEQFGIVSFGRWSEKVLLRQLEAMDRKEKLNRPVGVIVYPYVDYNAAFHDGAFEVNPFCEEASVPTDLFVIEGEYTTDILKRLVRVRRKFGPIEYAILGGHGTENIISFGKGPRGSLHAWEFFNWDGEEGKWDENPQPGMVKIKTRLFSEHPSIVLESCSTGRGDKNIAQMISKFGARVTAPSGPAALTQLDFTYRDGRVEIDAGYATHSPRVFDNGVEVGKMVED